MDFGFYLPAEGPLAGPGPIGRLARAAEEMDYGILAVSDHVVMPGGIDSVYPYDEGGKWPGGTDCLETLTTLAYVAAHTAKARLLSSVLVLPYRPAVLTAKMLASIDVLSGGRLVLGCGVGWMKEEFEALGSPPFEERGASSDEYLAVFEELWSAPRPSFDGRYTRFAALDFEPKPVQKPHPPIWVGGESGPALRRTARLGDMWYPISSNPRFPVATVEQLRASLAKIRTHAERIGRNPDSIGVAYNPSTYGPGETRKDSNGERAAFTGTPRQIADDIKAFAEAGVDDFVMGFPGGPLEERIAALDFFMDKVAPLARS